MRQPLVWLCVFLGACCYKKPEVPQAVVPSVQAPCDGCGQEAPLQGFGESLPKEGPDKKSYVSLRPVYFATNSATLSKEAMKTLDAGVEFFKSRGVQEIALFGHCDERGTREYNYQLGRRRVNSVALYLNRQLNQPSYEVHSLGEDSPVCTERSASCWAKNRRVELTAVIP